MKTFYRYTNYLDDDGQIYIKKLTYKSVRETKCFYIVKEEVITLSGFSYLLGKELRVPKNPDSCRRIHHTLESAWFSFLKRQESRIMHAELNLKLAKESIKYIKKNTPPTDEETRLKRGFFS